MIPDLYFRLVNGNQAAVIKYLQLIRTLPQFKTELAKYRQIYGAKIDNYVFADENEQAVAIQKYEAVLQKNPQSATALYNLSLLYGEKGNQKQADDYLSKVKELDPTISSN
jgi:tetratricopeptide (TPR) repeat protein